MANVKYRVREYAPNSSIMGTHSWFAEALVSNNITGMDLGKKIEARCGLRAYEANMALSAACEIIAEELLESNSVTFSDEEGNKVVTFYPKASGSVSDADILRETTLKHAEDPTVPIRYVAEESDLTSNRISWTVGATVGIKFSKQFALNKKAKRVSTTSSTYEYVVENDDNHTADSSTNDSSTGGNGNDGMD